MATPTISPTFLSLLYLAALLGFFIRLSRSFPTPSVSYTLRTHICFFKDVDQSDQDSAMLAGSIIPLQHSRPVVLLGHSILFQPCSDRSIQQFSLPLLHFFCTLVFLVS
ncbi:hypothetical protein M758_4G195800 [Ceratodon purpureus]|nr:hypothetical protein M758_4G195800 [Ceratodon purpureus]